MNNAVDALDADLVLDAFNAISDEMRHSLVHSLNIDGSLEEPAVQPTYIPAMFKTAIRVTKTNSRTEKTKALAAVFRYLVRALRVDMIEVRKKFPKGVVVIERDMRMVLLHHLKCKDFVQNPDMLDSVEIPASEIAKIGVGYE
jgi:hypothetical protein